MKSAKKSNRYKVRARREAAAVSGHEQIACFLAADQEYKDSLGLKDNRRSFETIDLSDEEVKAIMSARMDPRHDHLNELLKQGRRTALPVR